MKYSSQKKKKLLQNGSDVSRFNYRWWTPFGRMFTDNDNIFYHVNFVFWWGRLHIKLYSYFQMFNLSALFLSLIRFLIPHLPQLQIFIAVCQKMSKLTFKNQFNIKKLKKPCTAFTHFSCRRLSCW